MPTTTMSRSSANVDNCEVSHWKGDVSSNANNSAGERNDIPPRNGTPEKSNKSKGSLLTAGCEQSADQSSSSNDKGNTTHDAKEIVPEMTGGSNSCVLKTEINRQTMERTEKREASISEFSETQENSILRNQDKLPILPISPIFNSEEYQSPSLIQMNENDEETSCCPTSSSSGREESEFELSFEPEKVLIAQEISLLFGEEEEKFVPFNFIFDAFRRKSAELVSFIDGIGEPIPEPRIVVVGDQHSGKSSVLESISGIPFPRDSRLCTRCPIIVKTKEASEWRASLGIGEGEDHGSLPYMLENEKKEQLPKIIEDLMNKVAGPAHRGKFGGPGQHISVQIEAPEMPTLTMIDLPGIVRGNTLGQGPELMEQINHMIYHYTKLEDTVIVAVIPACVPSDNVEVLERLRGMGIDPFGVRTVGVLTKPELVEWEDHHEITERLANIRDVLCNGYYLVSNPSQEALDAGISHDDARKNERMCIKHKGFFKNAELWESRLGTGALVEKLASLLTVRLGITHAERNKEKAEIEIQRNH